MQKDTILFVGNHFYSKYSNPNVWHSLVFRLRESGWNVITTSKHRQKILRLADMVWTIISKRKFYQVAEVDVFSGPSFIWAEICVTLLKWLDKTVILTLHGGNLPNFANKHPKRVENLLASADKVTAPSAYLKKKLKEYRDDIQVVPNPIDLDAFHFRKRSKLKPKLVWVRSFHEIYNPSLAPEVLKFLISLHPDTELKMIGPDKRDGSLERMRRIAKTYKLDDHIICTGGISKDNVPEYLEEADIFINTTNVDNTPSSLIEAMASGLCIVSTNVGGIPFLLEQEKEALLVPPDNAQEMAASIIRLINEPCLAESLSNNARQKAVQYDWSVILPQWDRLLKKLLVERK